MQQQKVARLLAIGYTRKMAADATGYSERQVYRLCDDTDFDAYVQHLHQYAWQQIEPGIMANAALAVKLQQQVFLGDLNPKDPRWREASRLLDRLLDRLLYVEPPPDGTGKAGPAAAIQVNIGGGTSSAE